MINRINTCRFCRGRAHPSRLVKYGTRAYAHFACFAAHKTVADIEALSEWQRHRFEEWRKEEPIDAPRPNSIWPRP